MKFEQAKWYTATNGRNIRLLVLHSMEAPEKGTTAEAVAHYFANGSGGKKASAHYCFDNDSEVQCVLDKDVAYAAPGANHDGLHFELAGYAAQSQAQWKDPFSLSMLSRAAIVAYDKCTQNSIPVVALDVASVAAGRKGITTHRVITDTYHQSDHTDPGVNFPMGLFIDLVKAVPLLTQNPAPQGGLTIMDDAQAFLICPLDGGEQKLQADGGIFNAAGCNHYHGSYLEPDMAIHRNAPRTFRDIERVGQTGYRIMANDGATYEFAGL